MNGTADKLDVVLAQLPSAAHDPEANLAEAAAVIELYAGADLIVFPETYLSGYPATTGFEDVLFARDDDRIAELNEIAIASGVHALVGVALDLDGKIGNAALALGDRAGVDFSLKSHGWAAESDGGFALGEQISPLEIDGRATGVMVCFDMEFPEVARCLALSGAEVLISMAANMEPYGPDHRCLAQARAIENGLPHVYVNRVGAEDGSAFVGGSAAFAADGEELAVAGSAKAILELELNLEPRRPAESRIDYLKQRREQLYGALTPYGARES